MWGLQFMKTNYAWIPLTLLAAGCSSSGLDVGVTESAARGFDYYECLDDYYDAIDDCHERGDCDIYRKPERRDAQCNVYKSGFSSGNRPAPFNFGKCLDAYYDAIDDCHERGDCNDYRKPKKTDTKCDLGNGPVDTSTIGHGGTDDTGPIPPGPHTPPPPPPRPPSAGTPSIRIAEYNVENLFDTADDPGKDDAEFLPANGWTNEKLFVKLDRIAEMIFAIDRGKLPDVLVLAEVENANVTRMLARRLGYEGVVVSEGPDKRGIDTAVLYTGNVTLTGTREHRVPVSYATRNIFEADFNVGGRKLTVFANHWPSQKSPPEDRTAAAEELKRLVQAQLAADPDSAVVATGDFNIVSREQAGQVITEATRDVHSDYLAARSRESLAAPGTYYYRSGGQWNLLDRFFVSPNLRDGRGLDVNLDSYAIVGPRFARDSSGAPRGFDANLEYGSSHGYSDHLPITIQLVEY